MQLLIPLSRRGEPLFRQVYRGLRQAILAGTIRAAERLPSTRELADELGISRTVVLLAYEQLVAEGFATGRGGSTAAAIGSSVDFPGRRAIPLRYDFAYGGRGDVETFPYQMWRRILLRHARQAPVRQLDYGTAGGRLACRGGILVGFRRVGPG